MSDQVEATEIPSINVSPTWEKRFAVLDKVGAGNKSFVQVMMGPEYKLLSAGERFKIIFNPLAFIFTVFYYCAKGLWSKAAYIASGSFALATLSSITETMFGVAISPVVHMIIMGVICSQMVNYDYYMSVKHGKKVWGSPAGLFAKTPVAVTCLVATMLINVAATSLVASDDLYSNSYSKQEIIQDISGVWVDDDDTLISIDLNSTAKAIVLAGNTFNVQLNSVDQLNNIVTLQVFGLNNNQEKVLWSIRQIFNDDSTEFHLSLTLHDGSNYDLSFVRNL